MLDCITFLDCYADEETVCNSRLPDDRKWARWVAEAYMDPTMPG